MKQKLENYFDRLWPINRSLTGDGNRETLKIISEIVDLDILEIPSGTACFDWNVPPEWNVKDAWIKDKKGNKIVDFKINNLHLLGYSEPFFGKMPLDELKQHLYSLPDQPDLIPYLTSYYEKRWGFCLSHHQLQSLEESIYEVLIDSTLDPNGSMTLGESIIPGKSNQEVLFSTYICHPSMANNELSGPLVTSFIYNEIKKRKNLRYTYRFLFLSETIGSIYYLSKFGDHLKKVLAAGFVVTCIGDPGSFTYKKSRKGNALPDRVVELILNQTEDKFIIENFFPTGSDERQYCSPGFDLPVGSLMRTRPDRYKEYHTSGDNKAFISFEAIEDSIKKYLQLVDVIENNDTYINKSPFCEPQLGKRGLYPTLGSQKEVQGYVTAMMWLLNLADGSNDLIDIAVRSQQPFELLVKIANQLIEEDLLALR